MICDSTEASKVNTIIARLQWNEYVHAEFQKIQRTHRRMTRDQFFGCRFLASIVDPFHTMVHVKAASVSMDVHVCIQGKSIAAVTGPVLLATCKQLMGDREETSDATAAQQAHKRGEMVKMPRDSSGVNTPPTQNVTTQEASATSNGSEPSQPSNKRAKFLYMTLNHWISHKEKENRSQRRPTMPRQYWQLIQHIAILLSWLF